MSDSGVAAPEAWLAGSGWESARGLLWRPPLTRGQALVIPTNSVHTLGMRYALDLLYLAPDGTVLLRRAAVPPGRLGPWHRRAKWVVELAPQSLTDGPLRFADRVWFERRPLTSS